MNKIDLVGSTPLFQGLDNADLAVLAAQLVERRYAPGTTIFNQGDAGDAMYIVADGYVNIHLPGDASRRVSLKDVSRGEHFGELALFDDKPRSATALATTEVVLLELGRSALESYLGSRPGAAMVILRTMAERLRETNSLLSDRVAKNALAEIEKSLSWSDRLADKVAELNGSWSFIIGLLVLTVVWVLINSIGVIRHPFDVYPYVFFNLLLAILVSLQGPLIVMSQNRQTMKDRAQAETDFNVNLKNEVNIETILREMAEFRAETAAKLIALERAQSSDGRLLARTDGGREVSSG